MRRTVQQGPRGRTVLAGSSLRGGPNGQELANTARTATSVALGTPSSCHPGTLWYVMCIANGAGPWRCTAGVTPASTRTRDRRTEAQQTALVLCQRPCTIQGTCDDTSTGPHEDPLTVSSGRPSDERVTGRGPGV